MSGAFTFLQSRHSVSPVINRRYSNLDRLAFLSEELDLNLGACCLAPRPQRPVNLAEGKREFNRPDPGL